MPNRLDIKYIKKDGVYTLLEEVSFRPKKNKDIWGSVRIGYSTSFVRDSFVVFVDDGVISIRKGFRWNGLTNHADHDDLLAASLFHDAVLPEDQTNEIAVKLLGQIPRKVKDDLFLEIGKIGYPWNKRLWVKIHYWAVRVWSIVKG
jgi:hypothetical protein